MTEPSFQLLNQSNAHLLLEGVAPEVFDSAIEPRFLQAFNECPRHSMMLAVLDGKVIGMAYGVLYFHPAKQPAYWINEVGVTPKHQNKGIGRSLLSHLAEYARTQECGAIWVATERENEAANRCYKAVPNVMPPQDCVIYEWELVPESS